MTTLRDYLRDLIDEAVELGQIDPPDLWDKKVELLIKTLEEINNRLIGA